ncbi:peptidase domain-containing ABC transporter [Chitinophaga sp. RAB17]|uniref:peptidase domain-containing ABC transporter n=1 Tax=Chitinophaga sp. RAB17 TaxID=3233049 RepID=UPI003F8DBF17
MKFPFYRQYDSRDCGAACLKMIAGFYGKNYSIQTLRELCYINREGVSLDTLSNAAEQIGLRSFCATVTLDVLIKEAPLPVVVFWKQKHFVVVYKVTKTKVYIADPANDKVALDFQTFSKFWINSKTEGQDTGICLFLEPSPEFYLANDERNKKRSIWFFARYFQPYKDLLLQLGVAMLINSIFALIFPFLSRAVIDIGIGQKNLAFINLILISQLVLQASLLFVEYFKGWIFLHMGTRVSLSIISDFLAKLLRLPFSYFENRSIGDILQRMGDHGTIQGFLASSALNIIFAVLNFIVFGAILISYSLPIFVVFIIGNAFYICWTLLFLGQRKRLNYKAFSQSTENQNTMLNLLNGVQEIKLQNCERKKRWEWERVQVNQYKLSKEQLRIGQIQQTGSFFLDQVKNIIISYLAARAVLSGDITLGTMLSISYILGQLNGPIGQAIGLILSLQDTKIALDRLAEIHTVKNEAGDYENGFDETLDTKADIVIKDLSFQYGDPNSPKVLKSINLTIPSGKTTAIVGRSGSGKTTLVKLLLKLHIPKEGAIYIGDLDLDHINPGYWRSLCGNVSQDGFLFSDTIANNLAISDDKVDKKKLLHAVNVANIGDFIKTLPLKYNTRIGQDGMGVSQGQRQRLQIARAVYKNPAFLFLDEATNSLDAHNEKTILNNLNAFVQEKTVVIVAHRLSTVKNADQIVVLDEGTIVEQGTHESLIREKGAYYRLVKDQLEIE